MGRKQLKEDYAKAAEKFKGSSIKELEYDPETLCFSFEGNGKSVSFTLYISDDYPEGSTLYPADGEPKYYSVSLSEILEDVCQEYGGGKKDQGITPRKEAPRPMMELDELSDEDDDLENYEFATQLSEEIAYLKSMYGPNSVTWRTFGTLDLLNLDLHVSYPFVPTVANTWGVKHDVPLTVRLHISPSMYLSTLQPPKVEILQDNQGCGLSTQLSALVRKFCVENWSKFHGAFSKRVLKTSGTLTTNPLSNSNSNTKTTATTTTTKDPKVKQLMDMGFAQDVSERALDATAGDVEHATMLLLESPEGQKHAPTSKSNSATLSNQERKGFRSLWKKGQKNEQKNSSNIVGDIFLQEQIDKNEKVYSIDYSDGFLVQLYKYMSFRIPSLARYCIICDNSHLFSSSYLLRPAVCARELCCFAFQSLGVCAGATDGIATQAEVVDLLVCMALAAANSTRHENIFDPFPTVFDPSDANRIILNPQKKDFTILKRILTSFPSVEDMTLAQEVKDIKAQMDGIDIHAFPLLQWIITSNRSHIEKLHTSKHIKSMNTPHQYMLITAPPEKEEVFNKLKAKHGTTYAFHGSPVENWHCILRAGLKNASGTNLQLHGAAYGKGIYLSPASSMSFGYSTRHQYGGVAGKAADAKKGNRFLSSPDFHCVALCEVANLPDIKKNGDIWVCPSEDAVVTRFFFVFPKHTSAPTAHTSQSAFLQEVEHAMRDRV